MKRCEECEMWYSDSCEDCQYYNVDEDEKDSAIQYDPEKDGWFEGLVVTVGCKSDFFDDADDPNILYLRVGLDDTCSKYCHFKLWAIQYGSEHDNVKKVSVLEYDSSLYEYDSPLCCKGPWYVELSPRNTVPRDKSIHIYGYYESCVFEMVFNFRDGTYFTDGGIHALSPLKYPANACLDYADKSYYEKVTI